MRDMVGNVVEVGDSVAWATMSYRSAELRIGEITDIRTVPSYGGRSKEVAECRSDKTKKKVDRDSSEFIKT